MKFNRIITWADHFSEKISLFHIIILGSLFTLISIIFMQGGILYEDMYIRLPYYMTDIPLLNRLFESRIMDDGCYRARELCYLLDIIDFKFVKFSIENGFPHFLSLMHYILSIATGCVLWLFCVKELKLRPLMGIGWVVLFWTSPSIFFNSLNRTGKTWVMFLTAILFYYIYRIAVSKQDVSRYFPKAFLYFSVIIFMMTFLDEQGIFFVMTALIFLAIWSFFVRNKNFNIMLLIGVAIIVFHGVYRYLIAPQLTFMLNGYWPDFSYQNFPIMDLIRNAGTLLSLGLSCYIDCLRFLTGNPPWWVAAGLLILFILFPVYYLRATPNLSMDYKKKFILAMIGLIITSLLLPVLMHSLMLLRSSSLVLPEIRRVYYWSPTIIVLAMTLAVLTNIIYKSRFPKWLLITAMCLAVEGNINALSGHKAIILDQGFFEPYVRPSRILLNALKDIQALKASNDPVITKNPVAQFFISGEKNKPDAGDRYNDRGIFRAYLGLHQMAVLDFYIAIGFKQDYLTTHDNVIAYHELNRHWLETDKDINVDYIKQDYADAYNNRGIDAAKQGKNKLALSSFSEAISLKPRYALSYSNRGVSHFSQGNNERGCIDANKACQLGNCNLLKAVESREFCR
jgi:hypothetical protein